MPFTRYLRIEGDRFSIEAGVPEVQFKAVRSIRSSPRGSESGNDRFPLRVL